MLALPYPPTYALWIGWPQYDGTTVTCPGVQSEVVRIQTQQTCILPLLRLPGVDQDLGVTHRCPIFASSWLVTLAIVRVYYTLSSLAVSTLIPIPILLLQILRIASRATSVNILHFHTDKRYHCSALSLPLLSWVHSTGFELHQVFVPISYACRQRVCHWRQDVHPVGTAAVHAFQNNTPDPSPL
ncbi:hypothetical protein E1B28_006719 [Marasmius oreades]|uniref:Uncharacterized protein n=1 Tax=Marasmius oreades TaxID=181124 RepID=A0A9P7UWP6_9AGAR|nr:uncharacterized protein E1B28_006719 [Marasmius oreades]KAG7096038.1 hypothetical protein E1B28_006719 [Marasmius oreades]